MFPFSLILLSLQLVTENDGQGMTACQLLSKTNTHTVHQQSAKLRKVVNEFNRKLTETLSPAKRNIRILACLSTKLSVSEVVNRIHKH